MSLIFTKKKLILSFNFLSTDTDPNQLKVRNLTPGGFSPSPDGGRFSVNISWEKPTFNYSTLVSYRFSYFAGSNNDTAELFVSYFFGNPDPKK